MSIRQNTNRNKPRTILLVAILAAAWLIGGPDILAKTALSETAIGVLTWAPAMIAYLWSISPNRAFLRCEARAITRFLQGMRPNNR